MRPGGLAPTLSLPLPLPLTLCDQVGWHQEEQAHLFCTLREQRAIVDGHVSQMRRLIQEVKVKGLPGGEAHRIDNYINMIGVGFERLCAIKEPSALTYPSALSAHLSLSPQPYS